MKNNAVFRSRPFVLFSAALIVAMAVAGFASVGVAYADEGEPPYGEARGHDFARLEEAFTRLNEWYSIQDANIGRANAAIARIEDVLARAEELGIDTSAIQALIPELYAAVDRAEASHAEAGRILSGHAGFNGNGKVTNWEQALETCRSARDSLSSAHDSLVQARNLVQEIIRLAQELRASYVPAADVE